MRLLYKVPTPIEVTIYALIEPGTETSPDPYVRYVGQTTGAVETRLSRHIADAKAGRMGNEALRDWILKCLRRKARPVAVALERCSCFSADRAEQHHLSRLRRLYPDLLNLRGNPDRSQARPFTPAYLKRVGAD